MNTTAYKNISASAAVSSIKGSLVGMYVNSTNAGTIEFNDGGSATESAGVKATGTITASGVFTDGDTVTVDTTVYTIVDALTGNSYEVLNGTAAVALDNLKSAINATAGGGTTYGINTRPHPTVTATTNTDTTQVVEAIAVGTGANTIATTETGANSAWGAVTLEGGVDVNVLMNSTITPAIGYHDLGGANFTNGLYATIAGTALDVTIYYV